MQEFFCGFLDFILKNENHVWNYFILCKMRKWIVFRWRFSLFLQNIHARWGGAWYNESVPCSVFASMAGTYQHFILKTYIKGYT